MIPLRDYQSEAVEHLRDALRQGLKRLVLQAATGAGKTRIACAMMAAAASKGKRSLFLASGRELVNQCSATLREEGVSHGVIMAGVEPWPYAAIQVASKETLAARALSRQRMDWPEADLVVPDECHETMTPVYQRMLAHYEPSVVIGLSATPAREDGKGLGEFYQKIVPVSSYERLVADGYLCPTRVFSPSQPNLKGVPVAGGDYDRASLAKRMCRPKLVGNIVQTWTELAQGRPTLVFATDIKHALFIRDQFRAEGIVCEHVDQDTHERERDDVGLRLSNGETQVVVNVGVYRRGVDLPCVSCIVLARPTRSYVLYRQMSGRGMRPAPGKTELVLLDHAGAVFLHGFPDEDVEWKLSRTHNVNTHVKERLKQGSLKKPICCERCKAVFSGRPACPVCGHVLERTGQAAAVAQGKLFEIDRTGAGMAVEKEQQQRYWNRCLGMAANTGRPCTAAAAMYRQRFGEFPPFDLKYLPPAGEWKQKASDVFPEFKREKQPV